MAYETRLRVVSESNVNTSNNTSYVTVVLEFRRTDYQYYGWNGNGDAYWNMTVDGQSTGNINFTFNWTIAQNTWKEVGRRGFTITHNSDGSKTINMSGTIYFGSGVSPGTLSGSGSATLTKIARASTFGAITGNTIGSQISVAINIAVSSFTHMLWYSMGNMDWTHAIANRTSVSPITFTLPLNLCGQLPNAAFGVLRLYMETYDANGNLIGSAVTTSTTVYVPSSVVPSISKVDISEGANIPSEFNGLYVQSHSKLHVITTAVGIHGSTIKSVMVACLGQNYNGTNITTGVLTGSNTGNTVYVDVTVTDSRGRKATLRKNITITPYNAIKIHSFSVVRSGTGSTGLAITAKFNISPVSDKNKKNYIIEICKRGESTWTTIVSGSVYTYDNTYAAPAETASADSAHSIRLTVSDSFSTVYAIADIGTVYKIININSSKKGIAFGKFSEKDAFECDMPAEFLKDLKIKTSDGLINVADLYSYLTRYSRVLSNKAPGSGYSRVLSFDEKSGGDKYYIGINSNGDLYAGTALNGATNITWKLLASQSFVNENKTIVQTGTKYTAIKYPNGTMQLTQTINPSIPTFTSAWGSLYESSIISLGNWAIPFKSAPTPISIFNNTVTGAWFECWKTYPTATNAGSVYFVRGTKVTGYGLEIVITAIGKWK